MPRPTPTEDVVEILAVLDAHDVRYLVIGGIAAVLFGAPFPTYDLDICPDERAEDAARLAAALTELEAKEWDPHRDEYVERVWDEHVLAGDRTWLLQTKYGRLDVHFKPLGTQGFRDLARRRTLLEVATRQVPVAAIEDLIRMKEAAGRERDQAQLPTLRKLLEHWTASPGN